MRESKNTKLLSNINFLNFQTWTVEFMGNHKIICLPKTINRWKKRLWNIQKPECFQCVMKGRIPSSNDVSVELYINASYGNVIFRQEEDPLNIVRTFSIWLLDSLDGCQGSRQEKYVFSYSATDFSAHEKHIP